VTVVWYDVRTFSEHCPLSIVCGIQETGSVSLMTQLQTTDNIQETIFVYDSSIGLIYIKEVKDYQLKSG
jgi:hypothetical protein